MTPPWVGTFGTQIQSRPQPPRKLLLPQLLHVGAPVLRPTFYTLPLFMAPPVTYQPGKVKGRGLGCPGGGGLLPFSYLSPVTRTPSFAEAPDPGRPDSGLAASQQLGLDPPHLFLGWVELQWLQGGWFSAHAAHSNHLESSEALDAYANLRPFKPKSLGGRLRPEGLPPFP